MKKISITDWRCIDYVFWYKNMNVWLDTTATKNNYTEKSTKTSEKVMSVVNPDKQN